jgi:multidrug resistance protein, MATE family
VIAYGGIGLPIGYMLCFKTRFGTYGLSTGLTLALVVAAGLVPAFWLRDPKAT